MLMNILTNVTPKLAPLPKLKGSASIFNLICIIYILFIISYLLEDGWIKENWEDVTEYTDKRYQVSSYTKTAGVNFYFYFDLHDIFSSYFLEDGWIKEDWVDVNEYADKRYAQVTAFVTLGGVEQVIDVESVTRPHDINGGYSKVRRVAKEYGAHIITVDDDVTSWEEGNVWN